MVGLNQVEADRFGARPRRMKTPFRCINSPSEVIRLTVMMRVCQPLQSHRIEDIPFEYGKGIFAKSAHGFRSGLEPAMRRFGDGRRALPTARPDPFRRRFRCVRDVKDDGDKQRVRPPGRCDPDIVRIEVPRPKPCRDMVLRWNLLDDGDVAGPDPRGGAKPAPVPQKIAPFQRHRPGPPAPGASP